MCGPCLAAVLSRQNVTACRWALAWEGWVLLHLLVAWSMPSFLAALARPPLDLPRPVNGMGAAGGEAEAQGWWLLLLVGMPAYHALMALVIPAGIGYAPFSSRLTAAHVWRVLVAML